MNFLSEIRDDNGAVKYNLSTSGDKEILDFLEIGTYYNASERESIFSSLLNREDRTIDYKVLLADVLIGAAQVSVDPKIAKLIWVTFNPSAKLLWGQKQGIGTKSHLLVLESISTDFPLVKQYGVAHCPGFVSEARKIHLRKMGLEGEWFNWSNEMAMDFKWKSPEEYWRLVSIPFPEYYERSLKYARNKGIF